MTIKIGTSCSPAKIIQTEERFGHTLTMSCGGGMGGSRWNEYIIDVSYEDIEPNKILRCHNYKGEEVMLNTNFLVKCVPCKIVMVKEDISDWVYYGREKESTEYSVTYLTCNISDVIQYVAEFTLHHNIRNIEIIEEQSTATR